jgi:hypothetical protein
LCKPSITHLYGGDDVRIKEALEAVKHRPYQASSFRSKAPFHFRSSDSQEGQDRKKTPYSKKPIRRETRPREKPTAVPPRRGRARRRSESFKGGREGGPGLSVPAQTPCPASISFRSVHDYLEVGGRLRHFLLFWREVLETLPLLLQAVEGYCPPFTSPPPLTCSGAAFSTPSQGANNPFIDAEVAALLEKGAIEEVPLDPPPSFISNIFLVKKKNGGMRPVINLKRLNAAHLDTPHFRMETPQDVRHAIRAGDWAVSIDLWDA